MISTRIARQFLREVEVIVNEILDNIGLQRFLVSILPALLPGLCTFNFGIQEHRYCCRKGASRDAA